MKETVSLSAIPHRPPFLLVDEIVEVSRDRIVTTRYVDPDFDFFRGHYPNQPVMPGVLICESCFQSGALLMAHRVGAFDAEDGIPVLTRIKDARFRSIVRPGDTLRIEVSLDEALDNAYYFTGRVTCEDLPVLRISFVCMQREDHGEWT